MRFFLFPLSQDKNCQKQYFINKIKKKKKFRLNEEKATIYITVFIKLKAVEYFKNF